MLALKLQRRISLTTLTTFPLFFLLLFITNAFAAPITANPTQGPVGTKVTVSGTEWPPNDLIKLSWNFAALNTVNSVRTNENGAFSTNITVPKEAPVGKYINAINETGNRTGQVPFNVTVSNQTQPTPGWYRNSKSATIYKDTAGLKIVWENSYIYQHPGADNLYWYAQVKYLNSGTKPLTVTCVGRADPSLAKEHLRGTEGIPPNGDGYIPADETFCKRNPNFTGSIKPGGTYYEWAIFHNVPPSGQVALEWGPHPFSKLWVNPWHSSFKAQPPAVCPPELVKLGTCLLVSKKPEGKAPNLIVLVHGCCTDANGVKEWYDLGRKIANKIISSKPTKAWEVVVWDWSKYTPPPPDWQSWLVAFPAYANIAYDAATNEGNFLANNITRLTNHTYKYIHFIGHSAGAKLIMRLQLPLLITKKYNKKSPSYT